MLRSSTPVRAPRSARRAGVAAVEFAVVMNFVIVPLMIGVWEMGRAIHVQQLVSNAAREGARLAAQGRTISAGGEQTALMAEIAPGSNGTEKPNVKAAVVQSLTGAGLTGLTWDDVEVTFKFLDKNTSNPNPYAGVKDQKFSVKVKIPYAKVRWVNVGIVNPTTLEYTVEWRMLVDDPFTVNTKVPLW